MIIKLSPGDELVVRFQDTDGEFRIHFDSETYRNAVIVEETSDFADSEGRKGILYREDFSNMAEEVDEVMDSMDNLA